MDVLTVLKSQWDRIAAVACVIGGVILLIVGYQGIADSPYVAEELAYLISGGLGGVFLLGIGATLYVSADMHDEWRKLDRIEDAILSLRSDTGADGWGAGPLRRHRRAQSRSRAPRTVPATNATVAAGVAQRSRANAPRQGRAGGTVLAMPRELRGHLRIGAARRWRWRSPR